MVGEQDSAGAFGLQTFRERLDHFFSSQKAFNQVSLDVSRYLHDLVLNQDENIRQLADVLHGKTLGHPLHPVLTDITIGGWGFGFVFDALALLTRSRGYRTAGDYLTIMGTISAVPTAVVGMLDYSTIKKEAVSYGAAHGLLNGIAFFCYLRSISARLGNHRGTAFLFSVLGITCATMSAWLGGELIHNHRSGVNHAPKPAVEVWTPVMALEALPEGVPTGAQVNETPLLLFRQGDEISVIGAVCSHAGGPLAEGRMVQGLCIECPWHQSVFNLQDGFVVHGPSTYNQSRYQVRVRDGQIEIRNWEG